MADPRCAISSPADLGSAENPSASIQPTTDADRVELRLDATIQQMEQLVGSIVDDPGDQDEAANREALSVASQARRPRHATSRSPASQCMRQLAEAYSQRYLMPCFDPPGVVLPPIDPRLATLLPARLCRDVQIVPLADDGHTIDIAVVSPDAFAVREQIEAECGRRMRPMFAPLDVVDGLINSLYGEPEGWTTLDRPGEDLVSATGLAPSTRESTAAQAQVFLDRLLRHAIKQSATHIHLDRAHGRWQFRIRIDGVLVPLRSPTALVANLVALTIRKLARMAPSPAPGITTGWLRIRHAQRRIAIQVVGGQRSEGETLVLRFPDSLGKSGVPSSHPSGAAPCVLDAPDRAAVRRLVAGPAGITLIMSASPEIGQQILTSVLDCLDRQRNAIWTVDPPSDSRSSHVGDRATESFRNPIESLLRLDPDVLVVPKLSAAVTWADCRLATERGCHVIVGIEAESAERAMQIVRGGEASCPGIENRVLMLVESAICVDGSRCFRVLRPSSN